MNGKSYKSFAELYTDVLKYVSKQYNISFSQAVEKLSEIEGNIRLEYENSLIMDEEHYVKKFVNF